MKILFTNTALADPGGTEWAVLDMAVEARRRGSRPLVFSPRLGRMADRIRAEGIEVADDLTRLSAAPDLIHGHHHMETMMALHYFPEAPALYHCHGWSPWQELPPVHPRIVLYLAIGEKTAAFVQEKVKAPPDRIRIIPNYVDTERFRPARPFAPARLKQAVVYDRYVNAGEAERIVAACSAEGISCDRWTDLSPPVHYPEDMLPQYDLVFAIGKSAIEAMATGAAVILCTGGALGEMVFDDSAARWQQRNFSGLADRIPITIEGVRAQIRRYRPETVYPVRAFILEHCSLKRYLDRIAMAHADVLRWAVRPDAGEERAAFHRHALRVRALLASFDEQAARHQGQAEASAAELAAAQKILEELSTEHDRLKARLREMDNTLTWKLGRAVHKLPGVPPLAGWIHRILNKR